MLHERWHSAFFELIVGRTLQVLGATVEFEPGGASDTRVDFVARFPDATVAVEAVSPVFGSDVGETTKRRNLLLDIVESESPPDVWVMVSSLPDLGPQDSKKLFRSTVRRLLAEAGNVTSSSVNVAEELPEGTLRLRLVKKGAGVPPGGSVGFEPALSTWERSGAAFVQAPMSLLRRISVARAAKWACPPRVVSVCSMRLAIGLIVLASFD